MKPTTSIILAFALAISTNASAPRGFQFEGMQKMAMDSTCEPWFLYYTLDYDDKKLEGYFEVDDCLHDSVTVGDNTFTLSLNTHTNVAVLTEDKTGLNAAGGVGSLVKKVDDYGAFYTCYYGEGPYTTFPVQVPHCR